MDKLTFTDYVAFGQCQDSFGHSFWARIGSNCLDVELNVIRKNENNGFRLAENLTMGEADFNQFMRLRYRLVIAAENIDREEDLSPVLTPTKSKDLDEQFKLFQKVVDVVYPANRRICVILLRYSVDRPESCYAQVRMFARKKEDAKSQQSVYVKYKIDEFIYVLDVMKSV